MEDDCVVNVTGALWVVATALDCPLVAAEDAVVVAALPDEVLCEVVSADFADANDVDAELAFAVEVEPVDVVAVFSVVVVDDAPVVPVFCANAVTGIKPTTSTTHKNRLRTLLLIFSFMFLHLSVPPHCFAAKPLQQAGCTRKPPDKDSATEASGSARFASAAECHAKRFRL